MNAQKLNETVLAAAKWMAFERDINDMEDELIIFIKGKACLVKPYKPDKQVKI